MKFVIIMRGIPGSGKSMLANMFKGAVIHSTDNYFKNWLGVYKFDIDKLRYYHELNYKAFCKSLKKGKKTVIVDNTNTHRRDYIYYIETAKEYGYEVWVFTFMPKEISMHLERNTHDCPEETIARMKNTVESTLDMPIPEADRVFIVR